MSGQPVKLSAAAARRFMIRATGLAAPHASVAAALDYHGYVQIDPLNVCGRMHDLILRNRVADYREGDLMRALYADGRTAIESHHPFHGVLAAFPAADWRHLAVRMRARAASRTGYYGRLSKRESALADEIFGEIDKRGPLAPRDFDAGPRRRTDWGSRGTLARKVFEKLFMHGRLVISGRDGFRRLYDLPERVLPRAVLDAQPPSAAEHGCWCVLSVLRQRRLVALRRSDAAMVRDQVVSVAVEGCPPLFVLREDLPWIERAAGGSLETCEGNPRLLAPLDPLIYDRRITAGLWDFEYTWEVYTPEAKRKRGYYALPILAGERLAGHVDPRADRKAGRLRVLSREAPRGVDVTAAVAELARFLGLAVGRRWSAGPGPDGLG